MILHVSAMDPEIARAAGEAFESDNHAIPYKWWDDVETLSNDVVARLMHAAMVGSEVIVCFDEHDPTIGFVLGWNQFAKKDKHLIIVSEDPVPWENLEKVHRAPDLKYARSIAWLVTLPPERLAQMIRDGGDA